MASSSSGSGAAHARPPNSEAVPAGGDNAGQPTVADIFLKLRQDDYIEAGKMLDAHPEHWLAADGDGHTFTHWAALVGRKDFVERCIAHGCPVDSRAGNGQTPLMWASLRGHTPAMRALLDAKADIAAKDSLGATALTIAVQHQNQKSMLLLLHRGKDEKGGLGGSRGLLEIGDSNGCTVAHWAAYKGNLDMLRLLQYFDADMGALDGVKMTPMHRAVVAQQSAVVEFLMQHGGNPAQCDANGKSCFDIAAESKDMKMQHVLKRAAKLYGSGGSSGSTASGSGIASEEGDVELGELDGKGTGSSQSKKEAALRRSGAQAFKMPAGDAQKIFPVFWLVCVSLAVFQYIIDLRTTSYAVAPTASLLFELGVPLSLSIFFWVMFADSGKIPARMKGNSGVEEIMRALDGGAADGMVPDVSRLCTTTWVLKDLRTKYCKETGACVREFDHYCVWLNTAIGRGNHRQFILLAITEGLTQSFHIYLCVTMAQHLVEYRSFWSWFCGVLMSYPLLFFITIIQSLTMPWVCVLLFQHLRGICANLTTNEMINMHRYDHFWYYREDGMKRYRNPFNKGGSWANTLDFWCRRQRSEARLAPPNAAVVSDGCKSSQC